MISFYPGPSKVWDTLPRYMQEAWESGILSVNHRSPQFAQLWQELVNTLHQKLEIPENYTILPASSATECWEIIAQSLLGPGGNSLHLYNGAFGEKWFEYTNKLTGAAHRFAFQPDELPDLASLQTGGYQLLALTHNETSNGTALPDSFMHQLRMQHAAPLIAADATSSMGGVALPWGAADVWFASVQKCFGLPAGLALMVCSPRAVAAAEELGERNHYNSLLFMLDNARKHQTTHTPNVLNLYLLQRSLAERHTQAAVHRELVARQRQWLEFLRLQDHFEPLINNPVLQSTTILCLQGVPNEVSSLKAEALAQGFYLGNGYGPWKNDTFRIANFPAITTQEIEQLQGFFTHWLEH
ncbi:aminotransferase class V-fold PLP-dependent enzyme [Cesiribacter sp. SM1]|uniref:aminotransferase class V-fold PLP-dependent enzyme n=1 Tax=Cesiribacter sp. SM1 TaxID=2861196 RepID=UPI001CD4C31B|nr:aminotransferase class V-fold PLP-dependent enzyme [Cesiribacter sp. SM1]